MGVSFEIYLRRRWDEHKNVAATLSRGRLAGELGFVPDCYKTQKMCNKAVDTYPSALQFVTGQCKTHEMCIKDVDTFPFVFDSVPD